MKRGVCGVCRGLIDNDRPGEFCSDDCIAINRAKRRKYFRQRYMANRETLLAKARERRGRGASTPTRKRNRAKFSNDKLVVKVTKQWKVDAETARTFIREGSFPP